VIVALFAAAHAALPDPLPCNDEGIPPLVDDRARDGAPPRSSDEAATFGANALIDANLAAPCGSGGQLRRECRCSSPNVAEIDVGAPTERPQPAQTF
jgi:hypothetical protein